MTPQFKTPPYSQQVCSTPSSSSSSRSPHPSLLPLNKDPSPSAIHSLLHNSFTTSPGTSSTHLITSHTHFVGSTLKTTGSAHLPAGSSIATTAASPLTIATSMSPDLFDGSGTAPEPPAPPDILSSEELFKSYLLPAIPSPPPPGSSEESRAQGQALASKSSGHSLLYKSARMLTYEGEDPIIRSPMKLLAKFSRSPASSRTPVKVCRSYGVSPSRTPVKFRSPLGHHSRTMPVKLIRSPVITSPSRTPVKLSRTPVKINRSPVISPSKTPVIKLTRTPTKINRSPVKSPSRTPVKYTKPVQIGGSPVVFSRSPIRTPIRTPTKTGRKRLRSLMAARRNVRKIGTPTGIEDTPTSSFVPIPMEATPTAKVSCSVTLTSPPHDSDSQQVKGHQDSGAASPLCSTGEPCSLDPSVLHDSASMMAFSLSTPTKEDPCDFHLAFKHVSHDHDYL